MKKIWWKEAVAYQVYPRSFYDSNNDGVGDLRGIIEKLDYIKELGIDIIWVSPFYKSPNDDNGYDISDYQDIMKEFGNMKDFDELLEAVHKKGMKLIIDLVINHTSDEHPWFIESKSSKDNPKRDWYIWRDGKEDKEPNNWESIFGGSAWVKDEKTNQYYLHLFTKKQPDLNWKNKDMRSAIYEMMNWWLDKGIDGFRVDAISHINKEEGLLDMPNPNNLKYVSSFDKHMNVEGIHEYLKDIKDNTYGKYDVMTVGEANGVTPEDAHLWVSEEEGKFNMVFQFEHLDLWNNNMDKSLDLLKFKKVLSKWQNNLHNIGWNALFIENHDIPRIVSMLGNDEKYWYESSTCLGLMYFMQEGTPFIYQGQEIGMTNVEFENIEDYDDVKTKNNYYLGLESGESHENLIKRAWRLSRDNSRTPMQWDDSNFGGFSKSKPWININPNYKTINVKNQINDEYSILNFYKTMIKIRKSNEALIYGEYKLILEDDKNIYAYKRVLGSDEFIIITNMSNEKVMYNYKDIKLNYENLVIANLKVKNHETTNSIELKPWECRMYKI
ncbi:glycosyl hydrolase [[Clostridium] sordellii]|uniref:Alpha-amylase n=1 Tax=Paraclostridium sordellii TaxID=1505 RepID=A0ABP1XPZ4_PARSO|nr:alpha-glucosidase [Paeniclostridium sordellii]CEJ73254.1 Trehalose-6-phosphate hydrolase [[Clostridium] sordellii] [Paeniclostridium sordellii]CEN68807.1 glycosyl hydrolase [[Clostridium] sordellii] [Paeniclostridium sordellii]CEN72074.1 glycosyl hydrolase [[Clostridium] sordellii] [Paeniclostridium sordellii]CEO23072.1 glycosyl hydrolase [[Clostridium] sordellii] [Paeniclostridium sordellii]CEP76333.1 glycosyl hydrolase [[Clostridium] sordellii] [Paeniclostridium sordellii]